MALVMLFVAVLAGGISADQALIPLAPPPKCCFADQFEIDSTQLMSWKNGNERYGVTRGSVKLAFDYTNKRVAALLIDYSEDEITKSRFIVNHNKGYNYKIDDEAKSCEEIPGTPTDMMHCIPDDAKFQSTAHVGNTSHIYADAFTYHQQWPSAGMMTTHVTRGDCIQLSTTFISDNGKMFNSAEYVNYVEGIKNRSAYFDVPSYCPQSKSSRRLTAD